MSRVRALGAHDHIFCPDLIFLHRNKSRWQTKIVEDVEASPEGSKKALHVFEIEHHSLIYTKSLGV